MVGSTLSHYEIVEQLGAGPWSKLFKARERVLGDTVAVRIFDVSIGSDEMATQRFIREAKASSALNHRYVASILEIGRGPSGTALHDRRIFVVTPVGDAPIPGRLLAFANKDPERAVDIARQVLEAISAAHELGIVHGKLDADSIAISDSGKAVVNDFGMCRLLDRQAQIEAGSAYMAPEVIEGREPTEASDLYAAGAILYAMVAGEPPTRTESGSPPLLQGVSPELTDVVYHLLSIKPERRPASARLALDALQDVPEAAEADARSIFVVPQSRSWSRMLAVVTAVAAAAFVIWFAIRPGQIPREERVLAFAPFEVEGDPSLRFLSSGVSDALSIAFDSLGGWTSVGSDAVIGWVSSHPSSDDRNLASAIALEFDAPHVVTGSVSRTGDRATISANLFSDRNLVRSNLAVSFESEAEISYALDSLSALIAAALNIDEQASVTARTSHSAPALREFLEGSEALRAGSLTDAIADLQAATNADPDFGLAWSRLARAGQLQGDLAVVDRALERATQELDEMPPKSRTLTRARNLAFRAGQPDAARRLYARVLTADSTNVEALSEMGETIVRYNPGRGLRSDEAESYFKRALTYSASSAPILERLYGIAIDSDRRQEADSILVILNRQGDPGSLSSFVRLATGLEDIDAAERLLLTADESGRMERFIPGTTQFLQSLLAAAEGRFEDHERLTWEAGPEYVGARLVSEVMLRSHSGYPASAGKLEELSTRIAQWDTAANPVRMLQEDDVFAGDYRSVKAFLAGVVALKASDTETYNASVIELADIASETRKDLPLSLASTLEALDAEIRGDNLRALELLDDAVVAIPWFKTIRSELYDQSLNRYIRSEILFKLGRYEESLNYSKSLTISGDIWGLTYLGPLYMRRAETYARLGQYEKAAAQYRRLIDLWDECDPALTEAREAARAAMQSLLQSEED